MNRTHYLNRQILTNYHIKAQTFSFLWFYAKNPEIIFLSFFLFFRSKVNDEAKKGRDPFTDESSDDDEGDVNRSAAHNNFVEAFKNAPSISSSCSWGSHSGNFRPNSPFFNLLISDGFSFSFLGFSAAGVNKEKTNAGELRFYWFWEFFQRSGLDGWLNRLEIFDSGSKGNSNWTAK